MDKTLVHALHEDCDDEECPWHKPVQEGLPALGVTERDLAFFLLGAQQATNRFRYWSDKTLGVAPGVEYPSRRLDGSVWTIRDEIERATQQRLR